VAKVGWKNFKIKNVNIELPKIYDLKVFFIKLTTSGSKLTGLAGERTLDGDKAAREGWFLKELEDSSDGSPALPAPLPFTAFTFTF
jgi:hypothetical protein